MPLAIVAVCVCATPASADGACCRPADCEPAADESVCGELGGVFLDGEDCAEDPCSPGACCTGVSCLPFDAFSCISGGREFTPFVSCLDDPCDSNVGACCTPGSCSDISPDDCGLLDGAWLGAGTNCAGGFCDPGSCCRPGICEELALNECSDVGGVYTPLDDCSIDPCGVEDACSTDSLAGQSPDPPSAFFAYPSETSLAVARADNFSGLVGPVETVTFWGLSLGSAGGNFFECVDSSNTFAVTLDQNAAGLPGAAVCSATLTATKSPTGELYLGFELFEYQVTLPSPCVVTEGWLSVVGLGDPGCRFYWMSSPSGDQRSYCDICSGQQEYDDLSWCLGGGAGGVAGSCCDQSTGSCNDDVDIADCAEPGDRFVPTTDCQGLDPACAVSVGGCCRGDGSCSDQTAADCVVSGGNWLGAGADCSLCPAIGGCCLEQGFCSLETETFCGDLSWTWLGAGSTCADCLGPPDCPAESLFSQPPDGPSQFKGGTSEAGAGFRRWEDFSGLVDPVESLTWWGLDMAFLGGSSFGECVESTNEFQISFHTDDGGEPGATVCSYTLTSTYTPFLPLQYHGAVLNEYGAILPTPCAIGDGWVSIVGLGDPDCWFLWISAGFGASYCDNCLPPMEDIDLSICLHDAELTLRLDRQELSWNAQVGAIGYDIVRGDLEMLQTTSGNYILSTEECLANDHPTPRLTFDLEPASAEGWWFLLRPVGPSTVGSYDSNGPGQVASRAGINFSINSCP